MELKYRGIAYETTHPVVETAETQDTVTFLGARFRRKQYNVATRMPLHSQMTYRGIRYSQ